MPVSLEESHKTHERTPLLLTDPRGSGSPEASVPPSPTNLRQHSNVRKHGSYGLASSSDLSAKLAAARDDEQHGQHSPLLSNRRSRARFTDERDTPRPRLSRHHSAAGSLRQSRHHSRAGSWSQRLVKALSADHSKTNYGRESKSPRNDDERVWYDQFTSTDWVHDNIADAFRLKELRSRKDIRGRLKSFFDGAQGWILSALVGFIVAVVAYMVDVSEAPAFDLKDGYCADGWYKSEKACCPHNTSCESWLLWSSIITHPLISNRTAEFLVYVALAVAFATASCLLTLTTKTVVSSTYRISTLDEDLGALDRSMTLAPDADGTVSPTQAIEAEQIAPMTYYSASGSGVAEVKVILSGFVLHGFLGLKTLSIKTIALILSVASGLSIGKEGPFVHIGSCIGNIACRLFSKYDHNDGKRREMLSAAAASGVTVAFGAPIGGVLFSLEEASYFFPAKTLFRTFFCCITAALTLKFLDPYGTKKIVMFEVRYLSNWNFFEIVPFIFLGMLGGAAGAFFIKATGWWARNFRKIPVIKRYPLVEVMLVALLTALVSWWNPFTNTAVAKLLFNLASPCDPTSPDEMGLCPKDANEIIGIIKSLAVAFLIKGFLTIITFGIKVPAGIYVPSMVVGGILGRIVGHFVQLLVLSFPDSGLFSECAAHPSGTSCVIPGVYALIAAGATMCGVTRLSVTLAIILFELTGSLDYVLPFSLSILVAKWTADAIEPLSIYDLLINMNSYPFLNNKTKPVFTSDLGDIVPRRKEERLIDLSSSPLVSAVSLRKSLQILHAAGEVDGGLPIIRDDILIGLIPAPDLEFALDSLPDEAEDMCLMTVIKGIDDDDSDQPADPTDFTPFIDPAPMALDIHSPMDLVYECFAKLGLRYICVLSDGAYAGMLHRKKFVHYVRELEEAER